MDQLHQDVGTMVEKITKVIAGFRQLHLRMEEYVCLKVISMVYSEGNEGIKPLIVITIGVIIWSIWSKTIYFGIITISQAKVSLLSQ